LTAAHNPDYGFERRLEFNFGGSDMAIEARGVEQVPDAERTARPRDIFWIGIGGNVAFSIVIFGWLPLTFGLGWWSTVSSMLVGYAIGALLVTPLGLLGPRTGSNNSVSSGAHFGVLGRLVGSVIGLLIAACYAALAIWAGGQAIVAPAARLLGTSDGPLAYALGYAAVAAMVAVIAICGYQLLERAQKVLVPTVGLLTLTGVFAFAGSFDAGYGGGEYVLGSFWSTWTLAVVLAVSGPVSYCMTVGDWTRYVSRAHGDRRVAGAVFAGMFFGAIVPALLGAFIGVAIGVRADEDFIASVVAAAPAWYLLPILLNGLVGSCGQASITLYSTGLDLDAVFPRMSRVACTALMTAACLVLVYVGAFVWDAEESVIAFALLLTAVATPWMGVTLVGFALARGRYEARDLQVFNERRIGGRYWFTGGWNTRAVVAWASGSLVGLLCSSTTLFVGPLAGVAGGVDLSFVAGGVTGALAYLAIRAVFPESGHRAVRVTRSHELTPALNASRS
jgi:purine-cytosine permease-like protein